MLDLKSSQNSRFAPHLALLAVQLMFGSFPVFGKIALLTFPSFGIVAFRVVGAACAFVVLQSLNGSLWLERSSDYFRFALYALLGVILNQILFVKGLSLTSATNTSLLAVTIPVFATVVSSFFGFDKPTFRKFCGILLAAVGVVYLIDPSQASFSSDTTKGDLLIIFNCLCYASYIAISQDAIARNGALKSITWLFLYGTIICLPLGVYSLASTDFAAVSVKAWLTVAFLVLFPTIGAYYLNAWAMARVEPSVVAAYIYLQPVIGFVLAVMFLGEHFTWRAVTAAFLIFIGVFLVTFKNRDEKLEHAFHQSLQ